MNKIKLLVVDDSILFREVLARYIRRDEEIEVVGTAGDAYAAHDLILKTEPDVMTLDVEMPRMDGIAFLKKLLPQHYLPTIVVSSSEGKRDAALEAGAVKFIAKQSARTGTDMERFAKEVCEAIKEIKRTRKHPAEKAPEKKIEKPSGVGAVSRGEIRRTAVHTPGVRRSDPVVVLGASTGGTDALEQVLRAFPEDMPPVLVVQHMPAGFTKMYAERLNRSCKMTVKEAEDGDRLRRGLAIVGAG
ncbi:MAG: chemotaxis protein CheB, partial [Oscillospiraceae bacterium]